MPFLTLLLAIPLAMAPSDTVTVEQVMAEAEAMASQIMKAAPLAVRAAKQAMLRGREMPLDDGLRLEYMLNASCTHTADFDEGTSAFIAKRKPEFKAE